MSQTVFDENDFIKRVPKKIWNVQEKIWKCIIWI